MSDYPMLISNKLHSFRNFKKQRYEFLFTVLPQVTVLDAMCATIRTHSSDYQVCKNAPVH